MKQNTKGGKRKGSGRKKADYETKTIAFRVRVEFVEPRMSIEERQQGITHNVLQLGEVADLETRTFNLKQNINRSTRHQLSTKPAILPNCCYVPFFTHELWTDTEI
jgi:hypothetical protein